MSIFGGVKDIFDKAFNYKKNKKQVPTVKTITAAMLYSAIETQNKNTLKSSMDGAKLDDVKGAVGKSPNKVSTLLHFAVEKGNDEILKIYLESLKSLIQNKEDLTNLLEAKDSNGKTPVQIAQEKNRSDLLDTLRKYGCQTDNLKYPLHFFVENGNNEKLDGYLEYLKGLIKNEKDLANFLGAKDSNGKTSAQIALEKNRPDLLDTLIKHGCQIDSFESVSIQKAQKGEIDAKNNQKQTSSLDGHNENSESHRLPQPTQPSVNKVEIDRGPQNTARHTTANQIPYKIPPRSSSRSSSGKKI